MDKNTIIGFILIGIVLFGFSWWNRPTPEQIEAQRRYHDSIALVQQQIEQKLKESVESSPADELASLPDSVRQARLQDAFGTFAQAMTGTEELVTLENDLVEIKLSTKGGRVAYVRLKEYSRFDEQPLVLFDGWQRGFLGLRLQLESRRLCPRLLHQERRVERTAVSFDYLVADGLGAGYSPAGERAFV